jgi:hypothetical protein
VTVVLDGRPVWAYNGAYLSSGHVFGPLRPYVTSVADEASYEDGILVIRRCGHVAYVRMQPRAPDALSQGDVQLAPVLRALGAQVRYDPQTRTLSVRLPPVVTASPTPFAGEVPAPAPVFTPTPVPMPRPVWTGVPLPRRTPLPVSVPTPHAIQPTYDKLLVRKKPHG